MEVGINMILKRKNEYELLNQMLDDAISGNFEEKTFNESELSKLQTKCKRFLASSMMSEKKLDEERNNLKELITNISHQTRTPLTNVLLYSQLLEEQMEDELCKEYAEEIILHAKKLDTLMQLLVKMSRLEAGIFQFASERGSLQNLAMMVINMGKAKAAERNIFIVPSFDVVDSTAVFDQKWTVEAVYNILDNAIKYSDSGTEIVVSVFQNELFAGLKISDGGPGISEDELPRIFGRFYRGERVHDKDGIGVGLYLSREIIEGQGGYIKVTSKEGKGSSFFVYLPS